MWELSMQPNAKGRWIVILKESCIIMQLLFMLNSTWVSSYNMQLIVTVYNCMIAEFMHIDKQNAYIIFKQICRHFAMKLELWMIEVLVLFVYIAHMDSLCYAQSWEVFIVPLFYVTVCSLMIMMMILTVFAIVYSERFT